ncbi:hypothetical protein ABFS83_10G003100 [Erythranthe nasuta]
MTSSCFVATEAVDRKIRVIGELTRGREVADQLRQMLRESHAAGVDASSSSSVLPAQGLVGKILDSFTHSLSILSSGGDADEVSQVPPSLKSEDSGDSCKTPAPKDRRGCYKRRRSSETWTKETASLFEDGHAWRKYGQKDILNATHPRNYFRCTHKFDQGCQASKQVQKIQEDPPLYRTTYHGQHSCKDFLKSSSSSSPHHIIMDPAASHDSSSVIWSFGSRHLPDPMTDNYNKKPNSEAAIWIKEEAKEDSNYNNNYNYGGVNLKSPSSSSSSHDLPASALVVPPSDIHIHGGDYFISNDHYNNLTRFGETSGSWVQFSADSVISSCTTSTNHTSSMEMDIMVGSNFEDFQLEIFT